MSRPSVVCAIACMWLVPAMGLEAQEQETIVAVSAPAMAAGGVLEITLDEARRSQTLDESGQARFVFPPVGERTVQLGVEYRKVGFSTRAWRNVIEMNGSGYIEYMLNADGTGSVGQWPLVSWVCPKESLDVVMNGTVEGTTTLKKRVAPNRTHRIAWRRKTTDVCTTTVNVPMNVKRTYSCDASTGKVTGQ